ncbi:MAG: dihydropteroate synthase [Anaerolineales bacterium]|nr:dihydropteroate synthase [Anaerolineales bacterium]
MIQKGGAGVASPAFLLTLGMQPLKIRSTTLAWDARTYVMGILNLTPDSFSGDGLGMHSSPVEAALSQAERFLADGADILDVGGESTRPGADEVLPEEELARVVPVVEALRARFEAIISIDTYKSEVAGAALRAGADMVNDVWGLRADPQMGAVAARYKAPVVLMHNRSTPANAELKERLGGRYISVKYDNLLEDVKKELMESAALAGAAGIPENHIILDPGIGFGKTTEQNLALLNRLDELTPLGYPLLIGPSRKSFIGYTLDLPPDQRLEGTAATVAVGILRGANIVRVHDVRAMARIARMTDALRRAR